MGVFGKAMGVSGSAMGVFGKWLRLQIDLLAREAPYCSPQTEPTWRGRALSPHGGGRHSAHMEGAGIRKAQIRAAEQKGLL
ncbi:unnamed protein product [Gadus morhua 'NCC']